MTPKYKQQLLDSKPKQADYPNQEEFEEASGWWMAHQGRILALATKQPVNNQTSNKEMEMYQESQMEIHNEVTEWFTRRFQSPDEPTKEQ